MAPSCPQGVTRMEKWALPRPLSLRSRGGLSLELQPHFVDLHSGLGDQTPHCPVADPSLPISKLRVSEAQDLGWAEDLQRLSDLSWPSILLSIFSWLAHIFLPNSVGVAGHHPCPRSVPEVAGALHRYSFPTHGRPRPRPQPHPCRSLGRESPWGWGL